MGNFLVLVCETLSVMINKGTHATNNNMVVGANQPALNNKALKMANKKLGSLYI